MDNYILHCSNMVRYIERINNHNRLTDWSLVNIITICINWFIIQYINCVRVSLYIKSIW